MRFDANRRHWWARDAFSNRPSLEGHWLPILGLGGLLTALVFSAFRFGNGGEEMPTAIAPAVQEAWPRNFHQLPAVRIRLRADATGQLAQIVCNGRPVRDINDLRGQLQAFLGPNAANATLEAELDCDGALRYEHTQQIITAISACPAADGRTMTPLVERIKFSPRKGEKR